MIINGVILYNENTNKSKEIGFITRVADEFKCHSISREVDIYTKNKIIKTIDTTLINNNEPDSEYVDTTPINNNEPDSQNIQDIDI